MTRVIAALLLSLSLYGCLNFKYVHLMQHYVEKPRSILVLPVRNETAEEEVAFMLQSTVTKLLWDQGYYVFPMQTVETVLQQRGYRNAAELHDIAPDIVASWFRSDAVLYINLRQWDVNINRRQATTSVDMTYQILSGTTGYSLWNSYFKHQYETRLPAADTNAVTFTAAKLSQAELRMTAVDLNERGFHFKNDQSNYNNYPMPPGPYSRHYDAYYDRIPKAYLPREVQ